MRRAVLALALLAAACGDGGVPDGQIVARLDGEAITRRDVMIELGLSGAAADVDLAGVQAGLLDAIVARKLLAAQARRFGLDRSPQYLARVRRDRELILADLLADRQAARLPVPTPQERAAARAQIGAGPVRTAREREEAISALAQAAAERRAFDAMLHRLRARAAIVYQPGFGPAPAAR